MRNPFRSKTTEPVPAAPPPRRRDTSWRDQVDPELRTRDAAGAVTVRAVGVNSGRRLSTTGPLGRVCKGIFTDVPAVLRSKIALSPTTATTWSRFSA